jgi:hypothetical protein
LVGGAKLLFFFLSEVKLLKNKRRKIVTWWQYILICALFDLVAVAFILPIVFKTANPFGADYLLGVGLFVGWSAVEGAVGYRITRG